MKFKIFWRNSGSALHEREFESPKEAIKYMESQYGMLWHVQFLLFGEIKPERRPARRAGSKQ